VRKGLPLKGREGTRKAAPRERPPPPRTILRDFRPGTVALQAVKTGVERLRTTQGQFGTIEVADGDLLHECSFPDLL
jgi:hypothetical protein